MGMALRATTTTLMKSGIDGEHGEKSTLSRESLA